MISVKNIAGIICFFVYSKTTEKEKYRMQKEKKRLENLRPASILEKMNADKHSPASSARSTKRWVRGMLMSVGVESSH